MEALGDPSRFSLASPEPPDQSGHLSIRADLGAYLSSFLTGVSSITFVTQPVIV